MHKVNVTHVMGNATSRMSQPPCATYAALYANQLHLKQQQIRRHFVLTSARNMTEVEATGLKLVTSVQAFLVSH